MYNKGEKFYILTGLIYCGECGSPMNGQKRKNNAGNTYHYYRCNRAHKKRDCKALSVRADKIEKLVLDCFNDTLFTEDNKEKIISSMIAFMQNDSDTEIIPGLEKELDEVNNQINNLVDAIMNGIKSDSLKTKLNDLENKKENILLSIAKNKKPDIDTKSLESEIREFFSKYSSIYNYTPQEQSLILRMFVDRIDYKKGNIALRLKMCDCGGTAGEQLPVRVYNVGEKT